MKKEVTLVPKDKCPLDVLAEMGERIRKAWIFLDASAYNKLLKSMGCKTHFSKINNETISLRWEATNEYPATKVFLEPPRNFGWGKIFFIEAEDIAFTTAVADPEELFFLKMAE